MKSNQKWPLIAMVYVLIVMTFFGVISARKTITVHVDGEVLTGKAHGGTVISYLLREGIELTDFDRVTPEREHHLEDGLQILIERTVPVTIIADGTTSTCWVVAETVFEAVCDAGLELGEKDRLQPAADESLDSGMTIEVIRVSEEVYSIEETVSYTTVRKEDPRMNKGDSKVVQEGKDGLIRKTFLKTFENGVSVSNILLEERVVFKPVNRIVNVGTGGFITRRGRTVRYTRALDMIATGYWGDPAWSDGYTAIGMVAKKGIVAVDPKVIPLRTWLYVEGYGYAYAADVGRSIKGYRIDLCFDNSADAWAVGRRRVRVYVLDL